MLLQFTFLIAESHDGVAKIRRYLRKRVLSLTTQAPISQYKHKQKEPKHARDATRPSWELQNNTAYTLVGCQRGSQ
jgi:hypothetical protein